MTTPYTLGPKSRLVLDCIIAHKLTHDGNSPSIRQLMRLLRLHSEASVYYHLQTLRRAGLIRTPSHNGLRLARSIEVVGAAWTPPPVTRHPSHEVD